jgi:hypothetical protein
MAAGDFAAAETAYIGSLATSEQMGMVREMLNLMSKVARIRAATGHKREAVELLATVLAEPASAYQAIFDAAPTSETASATLEELQTELDADEFSAAHSAGTSRPYDVAVKELIDSLDSSG